VSAHFKVRGWTPETRDRAAQWLAPLENFQQNEGVGQLPEVFDGDAPQRPGGCIAQAWSVAELLRVSLVVIQPLAIAKELC
jgi:glycogen debranching enzyme